MPLFNSDFRLSPAYYGGLDLWLVGTDERDRLKGGDGDDFIDSRGGWEGGVTGGRGSDYFVFDARTDKMRIEDFRPGRDKIVLDDIAAYESLTYRLTAKGQAELRLGESRLRLDGVDPAELSPSDFVLRWLPDDTVVETRKLVQNGDPRLDPATYGEDGLWLMGTGRRDRFIGGDGDDYIDSRGGREHRVEGGAGSDYFVFDKRTDKMRIRDFELGADKIVLFDAAAYEALTYGVSPKGLAELRLGDARLRLDGVDPDDLARSDFVLRKVEPVATAQVAADALMIVVTTGQSLSVGVADDNEVLSGTPVNPGRALMLDFARDDQSSWGWGRVAVEPGTFEGFTPLVEHGRETPASGMINRVLSQADAAGLDLPDLLHFHVGFGGRSVLELMTRPEDVFDDVAAGLAVGGEGYVFAVRLEDGKVGYHRIEDGAAVDTGKTSAMPVYFDNYVTQLELLRDHAAALGRAVDPRLPISFIQGQSDAGRAGYQDMLELYFERLDAAADTVFGRDMQVEGIVSQTRDYSQKQIALAQLEAVRDNDHLHLGALELQFNASLSTAYGGTAHLNAEGYNLLGQHVGDKLFDLLSGAPRDPITISAVDYDAAGHVLTVDFAGVRTALVDDPDFYRAENGFLAAPSHFGFGLYNAQGYGQPVGIETSRIVDADTVELELTGALSGAYQLYLGRNADAILDDGAGGATGSGWGGTTLRDATVEAADGNAAGAAYWDGTIYDYAPMQVYELLI